MKFYIPCDRLSILDDYDCAALEPADFNPHRRTINLYQYANGWIYEADESFNTFFTLITGTKLPIITDDEYKQFVIDKVAFLSKDRAAQFRSAWIEFQPKKPK